MFYNVKRMCIKSSPQREGSSMFCSLWFAINWRSIICKLLFTFRQVTVITPLSIRRGGGGEALHPPCLEQSLCIGRFETSEVREYLHQVAGITT